MATAISKGTAVHSEAMGKGKGLGRLNASRALKAAMPGPAAFHGSLYPQSPLSTSARAHQVSPTMPAWCRGLQHAQQRNMRPLQFACHVQPLLACSHQPGQEGMPDVWDGRDHPPRGAGMRLLAQSKYTREKPQQRAQGQSMSAMKFEKL